MASNITLDSIVRKSLAYHDLPIHYYVPFMLHARDGLREMHFDTLQRIKVEEIPITDGLGDLPSDFVSEVTVGITVGDKIKELGRDNKLNPTDLTGITEAADYIGTHPYNWSSNLYWWDTYYTPYQEYVGRLYGKVGIWHDSFKILRDEGLIRVNMKSEYDTITLVYLGMPEKASGLSVIHPFAEQSLLDYIAWKTVSYKKGQPAHLRRELRSEFYNSNRVLRGRKSKLSATDIVRALRKHYKLSPKN